MYFVYVLRSEKNGRLYTGSCQDVTARVTQHNTGQSSATRYTRPFLLVHVEEFLCRADAVRRERFLKTGLGRAELARILKSKLPGGAGGGVAQLGERIVRNDEVAGSIPVASTSALK